MRIKKMPFEKNSFILSENKGERSVSKQEQHSLVEWLEQRNMRYILTGNILTLPREEDQTIFILRWMTE